MINQFVNKRTEILAIGTSNIANLRNYYNHVSALLISIPRFHSINFHQKRSKIKLFLPPKIQNFGSAPRPPKSPHCRFLATCLLAEHSAAKIFENFVNQKKLQRLIS